MATKRFIRVHADLPLLNIEGAPATNADGPMTTSHATFVAYRTTNPAFTEGKPFTLDFIVSGDNIRAAFRGAAPGSHVCIDGEDYERLKRATEAGSYDAMHAGSLLPFIRAILDATSTAPAP